MCGACRLASEGTVVHVTYGRRWLLAKAAHSMGEGISAAVAPGTAGKKVHKPIAHRSIDPILWPIDSFVLVESRTLPAGASYQVLRTWSLNDT